MRFQQFRQQKLILLTKINIIINFRIYNNAREYYTAGRVLFQIFVYPVFVIFDNFLISAFINITATEPNVIKQVHTSQ